MLYNFSHVIKSILELLYLWEKEHNLDFTLEGARKSGGTYAHHKIAIDFIVWIFSEKRYELIIINGILQMKKLDNWGVK